MTTFVLFQEGVKWSELEADHSYLCSFKFKNAWGCN